MTAMLEETIADIVRQRKIGDHRFSHKRIVFGVDDLSRDADLSQLFNPRALLVIIGCIMKTVQRCGDHIIKLGEFSDRADPLRAQWQSVFQQWVFRDGIFLQ